MPAPNMSTIFIGRSTPGRGHVAADPQIRGGDARGYSSGSSQPVWMSTRSSGVAAHALLEGTASTALPGDQHGEGWQPFAPRSARALASYCCNASRNRSRRSSAVQLVGLMSSARSPSSSPGGGAEQAARARARSSAGSGANVSAGRSRKTVPVTPKRLAKHLLACATTRTGSYPPPCRRVPRTARPSSRADGAAPAAWRASRSSSCASPPRIATTIATLPQATPPPSSARRAGSGRGSRRAGAGASRDRLASAVRSRVPRERRSNEVAEAR